MVGRLRKPVSLIARMLTVMTGTLLGLTLSCPPDLLADGGPTILSLGDDSYVTWSEVESRTGAVVRRELGDSPLAAFSVVILSNVGYDSLPEAVRDGLADYLARGGSLLVSGGKQSYGSGGYAGTALADLLPLRPSRDDFQYHPYGPTILFQSGHPILAGVEIPPVGYFNELDLNSSAILIAQYRKSQRLPMPLIAERSVGVGTVVAIALDMALTLDKGIWKDRELFGQNCVEYLLQRSRIEPVKKSGEPILER